MVEPLDITVKIVSGVERSAIPDTILIDMFCFGMLMPLAIYGVFLWAYSASHGEGGND
jgi:hypothetical protein